MNHDGWPDILAGGENIGPQVWLGDGAGGWTPSNNNLPTTGSYFRSQFGHVDHDGNLDILATIPGSGLKIWAAAEAAPPTISNIQPSGWITTTQSPTVNANVIDTGSGISTTSGLYRYSIDGGVNWSVCFRLPSAAAMAPRHAGDDGGQRALWTGLRHAEPIEFRASDMVAQPGIGAGHHQDRYVPPTAPTSISSPDHTVNVWSNNPTIGINWSGESDATSGLFMPVFP